MDFVKLADVAKRLVEANGRAVTLVRYKQTPGTPSQPWKGPGSPTAAPDASVSVKAVIVSVASAQALGISVPDDDTLKRTSQIAIVAPGSALAEDLATMNELVDGGVRYSVSFVEKLRPAATTLLYFIGVAR